MGLSYEEGKKVVFKGLLLLAVVTLIEVIIALLGNGHIIQGFTLPKLIMYPAMIGLSLYKAYFIVYEFMHMRYEVKGLAMSVLLPTLLLVWGVIAFLQEGNAWGNRRELIKAKDAIEISSNPVKAPDSGTKQLELEGEQ
jgi:cytochrome c oxidase subunit 4